MNKQKRVVKVAVVGSGLAGLTAAYRLSTTAEDEGVEFEVHLFEKAKSLGMDSHSISLPIPGYEGEYRVDVPMRSFQGGYYPQLIQLYKTIGIQFRQQDYSYSFSNLSFPSTSSSLPELTTTMIYNGASGKGGVGMPSSLRSSYSGGILSSLIRTISQLRAYLHFFLSTILLLMFYLRLLFFSLPIHVTTTSSLFAWIPRRPPKDMTLQEWTKRTSPSNPLAVLFGLDARWYEFVNRILIPLFSAVCTAGEDVIWDMPIEELLDYIYLTFGTHHYVVQNGVREVAKKLTANIPSTQLHLSTSISSISLSYPSTDSRSSEYTLDIHCAGGKSYEGFTHLILGTQANHAKVLLETYQESLLSSHHLPHILHHPYPQEIEEDYRKQIEAQIECLGRFRYCKTVVLNHTDERSGIFIPGEENDRRDLNLVVMDHHQQELELKTSSTTPFSMEDPEDICLPPTYTMATHTLPPPPPSPLFNSHSPNHPYRWKQIYQTTNPIIPPIPSSILSIAKLERAIVNTESKKALSGLWIDSPPSQYTKTNPTIAITNNSWFKWGCEGMDGGALGILQGAGRPSRTYIQDKDDDSDSDNRTMMPGIWICGSYAHCGIPLLEGCVVSAKNVVEQGIWVSEGVSVGKKKGW
ncbi:Zeta Carotene Desaturase and Related Oxidoreductase [Abortiporus biennis]